MQVEISYVKISYIVEGFRIDNERRVYYGKADNLEDCWKRVEEAFLVKGAHFLSLRRVSWEVNETKN